MSQRKVSSEEEDVSSDMVHSIFLARAQIWNNSF
jgi:hypothetical protein